MSGRVTRRAFLRGTAAGMSGALAAGCARRPRPAPRGAPPAVSPPPVRVEGRDGRWSFVAPDGRPFFSVGVSCLDGGVPRAEYDPENPAYARWRLYPDDGAWCRTTLGRLRDWGFNTVGAWGDFDTILGHAPAAPRAGGDGGPWLTPVLHAASTVGAPWLDMWDDKLLDRMDREVRRKVARLRDDGRVIGYYSDNELGWWNATIFKMTLAHPAASGQRRRLVALLRRHYRDDWGALRQDFEPSDARGFSQLERGGTLQPRAGAGGLTVMRRFLGLLASRYYRIVRDVIRRHDRRALVLGDRYQSFYYPEVARAAGPHVDVVSTNLNAAWNDGTFPRYYLDTLHRLTGRPVLVSEIYMAANENRTGNRNSRGVFPVVHTQRQRGEALRRTLEAVARLPYVVGLEWFQYHDEPRHGRPDAENFNFGLVDIEDRPYEEVVEAFTSYRPDAIRAGAGPAAPPDATSGIPPAPPDPFADFELTRALKHWDRERGFVPPASPLAVADLCACWSPAALYLGLYCHDFVEDAYYPDKRVPKRDRMLWTVILGGAGGTEVRARLGAAHDPVVSDERVRVENLSGTDLKVRNVAALKLPASLLGRDALREGDSVRVSSSLATHCAAYAVSWRGEFKLSGGQGG